MPGWFKASVTALVAVAVASRVPQLRQIVFSDENIDNGGSWWNPTEWF
jgi:hypothetical protein